MKKMTYLVMVLGVLPTAPAFAQQATTGSAIAQYSTYKPSGSIGTFGWYANGLYSSGAISQTSNAFLPGFAANLWLNPFFSVGVWGTTGYFGGNLAGISGPFTNADIEGKLKLAQTGIGAFDASLTGDLGLALRSVGAGTGVSPKVGALLDVYLPSSFSWQSRLDWAPWLNVNGVPSSVIDYKLGFGWRLMPGLGMDVGIRGQSAFTSTSLFTYNGPYLGFGYVF